MPPDNHRNAHTRNSSSESYAQRALTVAELAKYLGVRKQKIYAFLKDEKGNSLRASRVGRSWRINLYDFQDWMCGRLEELERQKQRDPERIKHR